VERLGVYLKMTIFISTETTTLTTVIVFLLLLDLIFKFVDKKNQIDVNLYSLFLFYYLLNMLRAIMCPSSGADNCVMLSPLVGMCCNSAWCY